MHTLSARTLSLLVGPLALLFTVYACGDDGVGFRTGGSSDLPEEYPDNVADTGPDEPEDTGRDTSDTGAPAGDTGGDSADTGFVYEGTGYTAGDVAYNLSAPDNTGDDWRLYQHDGGPVVLVFGSAQNTNFQAACGFLDTIASDWASHGVTVAAVMMKSNTWLTPTEADASDWAGSYGLGTVLYDGEGTLDGVWASYSLTRTYLIDGDMVIDWVMEGAISETQLDDKIHDLIYD